MSRLLSRIAITLALLLATLSWAAGPIHQAHAATNTVACSQTAVQAALDAGGSYTFAGDCTLVITPTLSAGNTTTPTTLDGNGHAVVFDGNNATQILRVNGSVVLTLVDLTLRQGYANGGTGGAIDNSGALTVTASTLSSNFAGYGGAVYNDSGGTVTISDSTLSSNIAPYGGAVDNNGTVTISTSTLSSNVASYGGAVHNTGTATISASTFASNSARGTDGGFGGAVYNSVGGTVDIRASTFLSNGASYGGAVFNDGFTPFRTITFIYASTFVSNTAVYSGGAVYNNNGGTVTITASTLVSNTGVLSGGGAISNLVGDTVTIGDTLLAGNGCLGNGISEVVGLLVAGHNLTYQAPGCPTGGTGDVSGQDPLLGPLADNGGPTQTLAVGPGSPAIGVGVGALCGPGATDQRGVARTATTCTIGAYESEVGGTAKQTQTITFTSTAPTAAMAGDQYTPTATASSGLIVTFIPSGACYFDSAIYTVVMLGAGTCTITAYQGGNSTYAFAQVQQSFTVGGGQAAPVITWSNPAAITYGTPLSTTQLDATASVPGSFTYTPASGTVLNAGSGQTLSVSFTPTDATDYTSASANVTIDVAKASQTISFGTLSDQLSTAVPFTVSATGGASGKPVTFSAGPSSVCTAGGTNSSTVTIAGIGTCTVTASLAGTSNYLAAPDVPQSFGVTAPQQSTTLSVATASGTYGGKADLSATLTTTLGITPVSGETIVFSLNGNPVCGSPTPVTCPTTDTYGVATLSGVSLAGIDAGTYPNDVSASFAGDSAYSTTSGSNTLTVNKANQAVTVTTVAPSSKVYRGTFTVAATSDSTLTVNFGSSGGCTNNVAAYTMTSGTTACTVTFDQAGNGNYNAATQVIETVTASKAAQTITFNALPNKTYGDSSFDVSNYASASSGLTVSFSSATSGVCTVSGSTVTIVSAGTCTINADQAGNGNYNAALQVSQSFKVSKAPLTVTADHTAITFGGPAPTSFTISYSGFMAGDTQTAVVGTTGPTCGTNYTQGSAAAHYAINCTIDTLTSSNYTFVNSAGTALPANSATAIAVGSFTVNPATLTVQASSPANQTFSSTSSPTVTCTTTGFLGKDTFTTLPTGAVYATAGSASPVTISATSNAGAYVTKCAGANAGSNYTIQYTNGTFTIHAAGTTTLYTGTQIWILGGSNPTWSLNATVSPSICTSNGNGSVVYTLDRNPITGTPGSYPLSSAPASTWQEGVYTVTATYTSSNGNCTTSSDTATLTIGGAGDSANGGGWTTVPGYGRVNFGFTVQPVPNTSLAQYKGQFALVNPGGWRVRGTLTSYSKIGSSGAASGTATVERWNATTLTWVQVQTGVSFTLSFTDNGSGGKQGTPDTFGEHLSIAGPPSFAPIALKGGNITVR